MENREKTKIYVFCSLFIFAFLFAINLYQSKSILNFVIPQAFAQRSGIYSCQVQGCNQNNNKCELVDSFKRDRFGACPLPSNVQSCSQDSDCGPAPACNSNSDCGSGNSCINPGTVNAFCRSGSGSSGNICNSQSDCSSGLSCQNGGNGNKYCCTANFGQSCPNPSACTTNPNGVFDCSGQCVSVPPTFPLGGTSCVGNACVVVPKTWDGQACSVSNPCSTDLDCSCGNGVCDSGENSSTCSQDCSATPPACGIAPNTCDSGNPQNYAIAGNGSGSQWNCVNSNGNVACHSCNVGYGWDPSLGCVASTPGECGDANSRTFPNGSSSYSPYKQCGQVGMNPSDTSFPTAGNSVNWTCSGINGGADSSTCSASQASASNLSPFVWLDNPAVSGSPDNVYWWPNDGSGNPRVSGSNVRIRGWALDNLNVSESSITAISIFIDGVQVGGDLKHTQDRPDVCAVYPGRPDCTNVGFDYGWDSTTVSNGQHAVTVKAWDNNGGTYTTPPRTITVTNAGCAAAGYQSGGFSSGSANTPSGSSLSVSSGATFYSYVDYGRVDSGISVPYTNGYSCNSPGTQTAGTMYRFACTVNPVAAGNYTYQTGLNTKYDYNDDGHLDDTDKGILSFVIANLMTCPAGKTCDLNGNGNVNGGDFVAYNNLENSSATACPVGPNNVGTLTVTVPGPGDPNGGSAVPASCQASGVNITWTAGSGATFYNIYRNTSNSAPASPYASTTTLSFVDNSAGGPYYYWVQSSNGNQTSSKIAANTNSSGGTSASSCAPTTPTGGTTTNNSCGVITINWTDNSTNETGFYIYIDGGSSPVATAPGSSPASATGGAMSYSYTPPDTNTHTYAVAAFNGSGTSAKSNETSGSIASVACAANITTSNKEIVAINGSTVSGSSSYVCQSQTNPLSASTIINSGDTIKFQINVCNNSSSSNATATLSTIVDSLTNLKMPKNGNWNAKYCQGVTCFNVTPTVNGSVLTFNINRDVPFGINAAPGILTFDAQVMNASSGTYGRFQNGAVINYNINKTWSINTPLILFYSGTQSPIRTEIPPQ